MTSSDLCITINSLSQAVCNLKTNNETAALKSQMKFHTDFFANRRLITVSFITFEYFTNQHISIVKEEQEFIREFLLTFLEKYDDPHLHDVFIF